MEVDPEFLIEKRVYVQKCADRLSNSEIFDLKNKTLIQTKSVTEKIKNYFTQFEHENDMGKEYRRCIFPLIYFKNSLFYCMKKRLLTQNLPMLNEHSKFECIKCNYPFDIISDECMVDLKEK
ncbi:hypothetical protein COBT_001893 [Conglomerata obtusa]